MARRPLFTRIGLIVVALWGVSAATGGELKFGDSVRIRPIEAFARLRAVDAAGSTIRDGSGVTVAPGVIITACHVVAGAAQVVVVRDDHYNLVLPLSADLAADLCLGTVWPNDLPAAIKRRTAALAEGDEVLIAGFPLNRGIAAAFGRVVALGTIAGVPLIATDAPVHDGMSGGGVFDARGWLAGIAIAHGAFADQNLAVALTAADSFTLQKLTSWPGTAAAAPALADRSRVWPELALLHLRQRNAVPPGRLSRLAGGWLYAREDGRCEVHAPRQGATRFLFRLSEGGVAAEVTTDAVPAGQALEPLVVTVLPEGRAFRLPAQSVARAGPGDDPAPWHVTWRLDDAASLLRALPAAEGLVLSLPGGRGEKTLGDSGAGDQYTGEDVAHGADIAAFAVDPLLLWNNLRSACF